MNNKIKISVLLAVFNTEFFTIKRAIDSVLNQQFQDFELIIIDDGSNNDTQQLLLNYAIQHESKITYLRHKNCGQAQSINRGLLISKGEYISIIDADDEYKPNHLHACLMEMGDVDLIASTTKTIVDKEDDHYVPDKYDLNQLIHVDDCVLFATLFGKRKVFENQNFQDFYAADAHFYEHASKEFKVKKVDLRTYIYYRNSPNSICSNLKRSRKPILAL
jgi:glycosyltransferase involved in cell wall biosynthesis